MGYFNFFLYHKFLKYIKRTCVTSVINKIIFESQKIKIDNKEKLSMCGLLPMSTENKSSVVPLSSDVYS